MNGKLQMIKYSFPLLVALSLLSGCAHIPLESQDTMNTAKKFDAPPPGKAGIYFYRSTFLAQSLKRAITVDNKCVGNTANKTFFYTSVAGNKDHVLSTEGEFKERQLFLFTKSGKNYFVEQLMTMGVFSASSKLKVVDEETGKKDIQSLKMALSGDCY